MKDKLVVGLDIGTTKICAIVGRMNEHQKLEILGMGKSVSEGVIRGMVMNINLTVEAIAKAVKEAENQAGVDIKVVNVGIAGQHIRSSMHRGSITRANNEDEISPSDVERLTNDMYKTVMPFGSEIIHVMPQLYTVDYQEGIKDPVGMSGVRLEADFHVITAQTNAINNINKCIIKSGLEIDELILEPIASSMSVLSDEEKEAGIVLVDIGGGTTDVAIFYDNIIRHTAVIPFGGNVITNDIQQGLSVMQKHAELLKTKFGKAIAAEANPNEVVSIPGLRNRPHKEISVKNLAHIIQARMEEIIEMVYAEIVNSGYEGKLAGGIVITGGGAQLQNVKQLFELVTGMDARIGYPNEHLGKGKVEVVKSPMYATAVGLVLAGFTSIDDRENKYAADLMKSREIKNVEKKSSDPNKSSQLFNLNLRKFSDRIKGLMVGDMDDSTDY
ncbi:MAG: cell division protein FtsA [Cytophagaceae bacterium]|jgi:cell division protein FtsA|nr:cell division protein FtsA [Cytophagaceae bacterium]